MIHYQFNLELVPFSQETFVQNLFNCKSFIESDRLLGSSKGRGITWFINTTPELGVNSVLRHYYRGGLFGKLIKDHYLFTNSSNTRAFQEFNLLKQLNAWGLPVPRPIAYRIKQRSLCCQADILLEKIENTRDLSQYLQTNKLTVKQYTEIGILIRQLHDHQVHHSDLNIHNILLDNQGKFWLIDFDKCHIQPNNKWKKDNLNRLYRSFQKEKIRLGILFNKQDWQALLEGYLMKPQNVKK